MTTYLINCLPSRILQWKSPYELLDQKVLDYANIRAFGSLVYHTNTRPHKDKFESRVGKGVFLGCPQVRKHIRCMIGRLNR